MNVAVFVSGNGTNLQAIIDASTRGDIKSMISLVVSDNESAYALTRAANARIQTFFLDPKPFRNREDYDAAVVKRLIERGVDLVVLAGYMRILSGYFIERFRNRILNIHPSILPAFKGTRAIKDAFDYGARVTGVTVHFVDEKLDHGPIILQEAVTIEETDTLESLEEKIHKVEHRLYPVAIKLLEDGKLEIDERRVKIK